MERLERVLLLCLLVLVLSMLPAGASLPLAHALAETPPPAETDTLSGEESRLPTPRSGALVELGGEGVILVTRLAQGTSAEGPQM